MVECITEREYYQADLRTAIHKRERDAKFNQAFADAHERNGNVKHARHYQGKADRLRRSAKRLLELVDLVA